MLPVRILAVALAGPLDFEGGLRESLEGLLHADEVGRRRRADVFVVGGAIILEEDGARCLFKGVVPVAFLLAVIKVFDE